MNKYILIGLPGSGKSTLGKRLANELQIPFFDTDKMAFEKIPIRDPFIRMLPFYYMQFREEEYRAMVELAALEGPAVIATGAEVALRPECAAIMPGMGKIIHLQREPENIIADIRSRERVLTYVVTNGERAPVSVSEEMVRLYALELKHYGVLAEWSINNNGSEAEGLTKLMGLVRAENRMDLAGQQREFHLA